MHETEHEAMVHVLLLGAPQTGKTQLAQSLTAALSDGSPRPARFAIHDNPPLPATPTGSGAKSLALLMGLDLPASPAASRGQQCADEALRNTLAQAGMAYQVVYGQGAERLRGAMQALHVWCPGVATPPGGGLATWAWTCETCSDPQCERRLLSDLLAAR